jgi:hypothetical protein
MTDDPKYRVNPDFVVPEPTAANFFAFLTEDEYSREGAGAIFEKWRGEGCKQARLTLVNEEFPNDPYPHGYWLEGWTDKNARQLPFGTAEKPGGAIYPALTANA